MSATRKLAQYAVEARYEDIPQNVVGHAKLAILDSLGCLLGGNAVDEAPQVRDVVMPMAARGGASVIGSRRRIAAPLASYINAQVTNLLDYDDTLEGRALGHPGATIVPPALALAEEKGASGKNFLSAVVIAYDVYTRVASAGKPSFERSKQVRGHAGWQIFGTVTTAARLLGLDAEAAARAFGNAAMAAPVPVVGKCYEERPMWGLKNYYGWVALGGILAAIYAAKGFAGNHDILDGDTGFWVMHGSDRCDFAMLTEGLGTTYSILQTSFKPYSSCRSTHSSLDALEQVIRRTGIRADQVRSVRMRGGSKIRVFADYRPQSHIAAEFSLPYTAAMMLLREPPGYRWVTSGRWQDPEVLALADRVHLEHDPAAEGNMAKGYVTVKVAVELNDGRVEEGESACAYGDPRNPMPPDELRRKFRSLAGPAIGPKAARELEALVDRLDQVPDVAALAAYLRRCKGAAHS